MRSYSLLLTLLIVFGGSQLAEAQLLKRIKERVKNAVEETTERKVEDKAVQVTDNAIDSLFAIDDKIKRGKQAKQNDNATDDTEAVEDLGDAMISGPQHGGITIEHVGATKVEVTDTETIIWSSWWTHTADIYDGYRLVLDQPIDLNNKSQYLNKQLSGSLKLAYDSSLPAFAPEDENGRVRAVTENYSQQMIAPASIEFVSLDEEHIQFKFSGNGYKGGISVMYPTFTENKTAAVNRTNNSVSQSTTPGNKSTTTISDKGVYQFDVRIQTIITTENGEELPMAYLINSSEDYFGMETDMGAYGGGDVQGSSVIVMDGQGNSRVFVDTPMMKMQISPNSAGQQSPATQYGDYNYSKPTKTGNEKTILGYTCYEYKIVQDGNEMSIWASPEVEIPNWMFGSKAAAEQTGVLGFVMEFTAAGGDGSTKSTVTAIDRDVDVTINGSEYKKMF